MADLQTISAIFSIVKHTWHTVEFVQDAIKAHKDADALWGKTQHLYRLIESIESTIAGRSHPIGAAIALGIKDALSATDQTLGELAKRCQKLSLPENPHAITNLMRCIKFPLSSKSIVKFEQQLQTNIISLQLALYILDREEHKDLARNVEEIRATLSAADRLQNLNNAQQSPEQPDEVHDDDDESRDQEKIVSSAAVLAALDRCIAAATTTINLPPESNTASTSVPHTEVGTNLDSGSNPRSNGLNESSASTADIENLSSSVRIELIEAIHQHFPDRFAIFTHGDDADINERDGEGYTPLMYTVSQHEETCQECHELLQKLLQQRPDVNISNKGQTALTLAIRRNRPAMVESLLAAQPNMDIIDDSGWTFIHHAVAKQSKEAFQSLLEHAASESLNINLEARCDLDMTPLMHLAENAQRPENIELAKLLLQHGADINTTDNSEFSALYYAVAGRKKNTQRNNFIRLLLDEGADVNVIKTFAPDRIKIFTAFREHEDSKRRDSAISASATTGIYGG
ncbi:ankyrin [Plenodomus tracheiphilus IPT5]|uniref:Ankyrin n=1 Tax=Plenodomus tracheiphilus IPT5 TaxID=1408161 RepID=A0A6A7BH51_9PLEO|nr:ankyrin [Plenodomus tracheiphilus IPT5]